MTKVRAPRTFGIWLPSETPLAFGDITISIFGDNAELVEHGEVWVPRSFSAEFDRTGLPILDLDIALLDNRFRCVQLRARRRTETDYIETRHFQTGIVALVKEAVELVSYLRVELETQEDVAFARNAFATLADLETDPIDLDDIEVGDYFRFSVLTPLIASDADSYTTAYLPFTRRAINAAERPKPRGPASNEGVANVYRVAYAQNKEVIDAVATAFGWERQTAKNRIRAARKQGLLPATVAGSRRA